MNPCNTLKPQVVLGSCVAAGACFGHDALGRPGSGSAIQQRCRRWWGRFGGGGGGRVRVDRVRDGVLLVPRAVQWTSSCDHAETSSAVLYRISLTSGWCLSFSSSTEFFLVVKRDRYPQLRFSEPGSRVLQYIDKVVDVPGDAVALWRLVEEFHIFSSCCTRCSPGIWTLFP